MPITISQAHNDITQFFIKLDPALEGYKVFYDAGIRVAAIDALELVRRFNEGEEKVSLPAWLFHAALTLAKERLENSKSIAKGHLGSEGKTALRNHKVLVRYIAVIKLKHDGITWEQAFTEASAVLEKTPAHSEPSGIKKSYLELKNALADGSDLLKYYPLSWEWAKFYGENQ